MKELLKQITKCNNVDNFVDFYNYFVESARQFNLTSILDQKEIVIKHFEDSLKGLMFFENNKKVVEIGSGGGFPSVPLKIENPSLDFTLIEATKKKCDYLNGVKNLLNFDKFNVVNGRAEELSKSSLYRESFDYAVARAVAPLNILVEYLVPYLKVGGFAICYKGSNYLEELKNAEHAFIELGCEISEVYAYSLSENYGEHAIIKILKKAKTKDKYPRNEGRIRKQPLWMKKKYAPFLDTGHFPKILTEKD